VLNAPFLSPEPRDLVLDLGAGVYEEIVFRFLAIRGIFLLLRLDPFEAFDDHPRASRGSVFSATAVAVLVSSLLFALYHHVGPGGDPFAPALFAFRTLAGLLLALIYFCRGLAAAVYTHAFYDVLVHLSA
jgi:membrane protease YdiL (CAAX protease family)